MLTYVLRRLFSYSSYNKTFFRSSFRLSALPVKCSFPQHKLTTLAHKYRFLFPTAKKYKHVSQNNAPPAVHTRATGYFSRLFTNLLCNLIRRAGARLASSRFSQLATTFPTVSAAHLVHAHKQKGNTRNFQTILTL